ncbi:phosphopantetheine-binding protein [Streptosporangium vulgare]|uniref:phosphopantetheine-binding protein n=1 Tax=Streptosporangium vulgare TaxID=46190 RepID=UPI003CD09A81
MVAYVVRHDRTAAGQAADAGELREYLAAELPPHLVPSAVVEVGHIPLTPSGKVDQGALPAPEHRSGEGYLPPENATQELVCSVWAEVLGVERVGALDDFFQLGGHSLLATRTIARLSAATGLDVPLKLAFGHPSVRSLARALDALAEAGSGAGSRDGTGTGTAPGGHGAAAVVRAGTALVHGAVQPRGPARTYCPPRHGCAGRWTSRRWTRGWTPP